MTLWSRLEDWVLRMRAVGSRQPVHPSENLLPNGATSSSAADAQSRGLEVAMSAPARPRFLNGGKHAKGLARFGLPKGAIYVYIDDLYHTLLNMPRARFLFSFFGVYLTLYLAGAIMYLMTTEDCLGGPVTFPHTLWFSVQTASTIGYSTELVPSVDCWGINILVTFHIICAALIDTMLMSLVFSRFAAPAPRASTIRFSQHAVLYRREATDAPNAVPTPRGGSWCLSFRVANIRKHSLLDPEVVLLLAVPDKTSGSNAAFRFHNLYVEDPLTQITSLKLGLPATITHVITPASPLYDLSLTDMEAHDMELLCFMSGTDPMTSNLLQARHAYVPADVRMNERFVGINMQQNRKGKVGLDFSAFDETYAVHLGAGESRNASNSMLYPLPSPGYTSEGLRGHMADLRRKTFRSISFEEDRVVGGRTTTSPGSQAHNTLSLPPGAGVGGSTAGSQGGDGTAAVVVQGGGGEISGDPLGAQQKGLLLPVSYMGGAGSNAGSPRGTSAGGARQLDMLGGSMGSVGHGALSINGANGLRDLSGWDRAVGDLCEALLQDEGAAEHVKQRAANLRAALTGVPAPLVPMQSPTSGIQTLSQQQSRGLHNYL